MKPNLIGYACDLAANEVGSANGPFVLQKSTYLKPLELEWIKIVETAVRGRQLQAMNPVQSLCQQIAHETKRLAEEEHPFLTIGGDHSMAIGTWNGAAAGLKEPLGLVWIDAHMDAHTPGNSTTKNIHGMPVATLLGYGDKKLTHIASDDCALLPDNIALIGIRNFGEPEQQLLNTLKVKVYFIEEVLERGIHQVMQEAIAHVLKNTKHLGISIDIDGLDPQDAPGVSTPEPNGIRSKDFIESLSLIAKNPHFIGAEIAEFNPKNDRHHQTEKVIAAMIKKLFSK